MAACIYAVHLEWSFILKFFEKTPRDGLFRVVNPAHGKRVGKKFTPAACGALFRGLVRPGLVFLTEILKVRTRKGLAP
jgi:hypothetical protein